MGRPHGSLDTQVILLKPASVRPCLCPAQNSLTAPPSLTIKSRALTMPCRNWLPREPLSSSLPRLLSFSCNMPVGFLPPGICPCNSVCWGHSFPNLHVACSLTSFRPLLESHLQKDPWLLYFKGSCSSPAPSTAVLFCNAFLTTQLHGTY